MTRSRGSRHHAQLNQARWLRVPVKFCIETASGTRNHAILPNLSEFGVCEHLIKLVEWKFSNKNSPAQKGA